MIGPPAENGVRFCHGCGKATTFVPYQEPEYDEDGQVKDGD